MASTVDKLKTADETVVRSWTLFDVESDRTFWLGTVNRSISDIFDDAPASDKVQFGNLTLAGATREGSLNSRLGGIAWIKDGKPYMFYVVNDRQFAPDPQE